jgi:enoyl-CoA hydratase
MTNPVFYELDGRIATIRIDDGKRNALAPAVLAGLRDAFDRARRDDAPVIVTGREDVFSAGFDLKVMARGGPPALRMLAAGYGLTAIVLNHPRPVVAACNGHALAMGVFLMLSADYVIGARGEFRISANEVAIGMTMPRVAEAVLRNRLTPAACQRAVALSADFDTEAAVMAGLFDEAVVANELAARARTVAEALLELDPVAHRVSKRRMRAALTRRIRLSLPLDLVDAALQGLRRRKAD